MADLLDKFNGYVGFQRRVAGRLATDVANTGIDLINSVRSEGAKYRPIDMEEDVFDVQAEIAANAIAALAGPERGQAAKRFLMEQTRAPESTAGEISEDMAVFVMGFLGAQKALKGGLKGLSGASIANGGAGLSKAAQWGSTLAAGGIADFTFSDPSGPRLSNFIPEQYRPAFIEYLAADPSKDEGRLEARLKNSIEGAALGTALDGILGVFRAARQSSVARHMGDGVAQAADHEAATGLSQSAIKAQQEAGAFLESKLVQSIDMSPAGIQASREAGVTPGRAATKDPEALRQTVIDSFEAVLDTGRPLQEAAAHAINTARLNLDDLAQQDLELAGRTIEVVAKGISDSIDRRIVSHEETLRAAGALARKQDKSLQKLEKNLNKLRGSIAKARPELVMYRAMMTDSLKSTIKLSQKIARGEDLSEKALREFSTRMSLHMTLQAGVEGSASEAGRLLNSLKIRPGSGVVPKELTDVFGKEVLDEDELKIWNAINAGDSEELQRLAKTVASADPNAIDIKGMLGGLKGVTRFMNFLKGIRVRNMLSGFPTHAVGGISNAMSTLMINAVEAPLAAFRAADGPDQITTVGALKGLHRAALEPLNMTKRYHGYLREHTKDIKGIRAKTRAVMDAMSIDDTDRFRVELGNADIRWNDNHAVAKLWNSWADIMDITSLGAMRFVDDVAKNINFTAETTSISTSRGIAKGLRGADLDRFVAAQVDQARAVAQTGTDAEGHLFTSLVDGGMDSKDAAKYVLDINDLAGQGQQIAKRAVFQDEINNEFIKGIEGALNNQNSVTAQAIKTFIVPFFRTPVKLMAFVGDRTPILNKLSVRNKEILQGLHGPRAQQRLRAQTLTGAAMYTSAGMLAMNGQLTGKHRADERDSLIAAGIPEYSIRIPNSDKWISFSRADPFAVFLGIAADIHTISQDQDEPSFAAAAASGVVTALTSNIFHKTFMKGLADTMMAFEDPKAYGPYLLDSNIRSTIPTLTAFQSTFEKVWNANSEEYRKQRPDPSFNELRDWLDLALGNMGVGRQTDMRDALGNPVKRSPLVSELLGFRQAETTDSPALRELARLKRFPGNRELSLAPGFKMSHEEFQAFKQVLGEDVKITQRLDRIVSSSGYKRMSNEQRSKALFRVIRQARDVGKAIKLRKDPDLRTKLLEFNRDRLRQAMTQTERDAGVVTLADILTQRRQTFERQEE